jgi:putative ABC transport system permease protein
MDHENLRFKVVGLLASTATPIDRSVFVSLEAIEAMHAGWEDGAPPVAGEELPESEVSSAELEPVSISGFYLKAKTRIKVLDLQREIAENPEEPLTAVIPGVVIEDPKVVEKSFPDFWSVLESVGIAASPL